VYPFFHGLLFRRGECEITLEIFVQFLPLTFPTRKKNQFFFRLHNNEEGKKMNRTLCGVFCVCVFLYSGGPFVKMQINWAKHEQDFTTFYLTTKLSV
jgi:hypothetical protein